MRPRSGPARTRPDFFDPPRHGLSSHGTFCDSTAPSAMPRPFARRASVVASCAVMENVSLRVIGFVENGRTSRADAEWGGLESTLMLRSEFLGGLSGIEQFSHAVVIFFMIASGPALRPT